jgi:lipopolysaccharide transport system permease protein
MITNSYTPHGKNPNIERTWLSMAIEIWNSRELLWRLINRDVSARYRHSYFGYIWAIVPQVVTVIIFSILSSRRVISIGELSMPYVIHAIWSVSVWQLFASCVLSSTNSLVNAGSLVTKANFPKSILVFSACGQAFLDFAIRLVPIVFVMLFYKFIPSWHTLFIPFILICIMLLALGVGFVLSILNLALRDIGSFLSIALSFGVFLSPVFYPPPSTHPFSLVNILNPFSPLLIATQEMLSGMTFNYPISLMVMIFVSFICFLSGWRLFNVTMPRITERA